LKTCISGYLVGEKLFTFLFDMKHDEHLAGELDGFIAGIKTIFARWQLRCYSEEFQKGGSDESQRRAGYMQQAKDSLL
jgi:hypothetical protein